MASMTQRSVDHILLYTVDDDRIDARAEIDSVAVTEGGDVAGAEPRGGAGNDVYLLVPGDGVDTPLVIEAAGDVVDRVDTPAAIYALPDDVENPIGTSATEQTLRGNAANNDVTGGDGDDFFDLRGPGTDTANGGAGNDAFLFDVMTSADFVDGGSGTNDQLGIQGDNRLGNLIRFRDVEVLLFLSGSDTRFGDVAGNRYAYDFVMEDANVAAGQTLTLDANRLGVGENVTFDGSAETDGAYFVYAGLGVDDYVGGARGDTFLFRDGGLTASDRIDGGGGFDQIGLRGHYAGANAVTFGATSMNNVEGIVVISGRDTRFGRDTGASYSYDLTSSDANVAAGMRFTVDAGTLRAGETLRFDGRAETNGSFQLFGGDGDDVLIGGGGGDLFDGGLGADRLAGGVGGGNVYRYNDVADSTPASRDFIGGFSIATDRIDLSRIDADTKTDGNNAFTFIGEAAFSGRAGELRFTFNVSSYEVQGDTNGDGLADLMITVVASGMPPLLDANNFIL